MSSNKTKSKKNAPEGGAKKSPAIETKSSKALVAFETQDGNKAYQHFLPLVQAEIPADQAQVCVLDVALVLTNAMRGVEAIRPHLDLIVQRQPDTQVQHFLEIPALALGLVAAANRVIPIASEKEIATRLATFRPSRELTLLQLQVFAGLGMISKDIVTDIRAGTGPIDSARDGLKIADAFEKNNAAFENKHPFSKEYLTKMEADANWLLIQLTPSQAQREGTGRLPEAIVRDQFWTLLNQRYERMREAGVIPFGLKNLDANIPPLGSRVASARQPEPVKTDQTKTDVTVQDATKSSPE